MKIYTKTGDGGDTGLLGGDRTPKTSLRIAAIGDVDELNAAVGLAATEADERLRDRLYRMQSLLFELGGELACPPGGKFGLAVIDDVMIAELETEIDQADAELAPLKNFILPGGAPTAARLHLARAVCRRAERTILALDAEEPVRAEPKRFLNRSSDWLFTMARLVNHRANVPDIPWRSYVRQ